MQKIVMKYNDYTLSKSMEKNREGNRQKTIRRKAYKKRRKEERIYYIKQKLCGLLLTCFGILTPFVMDGDATASLMLLPMGVRLLLTRDKIMMF